MRPLVTKLRGKTLEVNFWYNKTEEIIYSIYNKSENADERFQLVFAETVILTNKFGTEEKTPRPNTSE